MACNVSRKVFHDVARGYGTAPGTPRRWRATFPEKCSTMLHGDMGQPRGRPADGVQRFPKSVPRCCTGIWDSPGDAPPTACNVSRKVFHDVARGYGTAPGTPRRRREIG